MRKELSEIRDGLNNTIAEIQTNKMYGLISNTLEDFLSISKNFKDPTEDLLEILNDEALKLICFIFKEEMVLRKRKEQNRIYYSFLLNENLIFEYGIEETEE